MTCTSSLEEITKVSIQILIDFNNSLFQLMCKCKANVTIENKSGFNARDWANEHKKLHIENILAEQIFVDSPKTRRK